MARIRFALIAAAGLCIGTGIAVNRAAAEETPECEMDHCSVFTGDCQISPFNYTCKETIEDGLDWCRNYSCPS